MNLGIKHLPLLSLSLLALPEFSWGQRQLETGTTLTSNTIGVQGEYHIEYWKDSGSGSMLLNEGGDFECEWDANNILFRKGVRPGDKDRYVNYSADYNPVGNSYLGVYGWTQNPLVEYYIVDSWGTWRPPGSQSKGTVESDGGTYDIYETTRTNQPSIVGTATFQQYWSVRKTKQTSGTITTRTHFDAWEDLGMNMGNFYEVSFKVEGYQSSGQADVQMSMFDEPPPLPINPFPLANQKVRQGIFQISQGSPMPLTFIAPDQSYESLRVFNQQGQLVLHFSGVDPHQSQNSLAAPAALSPGVYFWAMDHSQP